MNTIHQNALVVVMVIVAALLIFNQVQISAIATSFDGLVGVSKSKSISLFRGSGSVDLKGVDVSESTSTPMTVALVFPELKDASSDDIVSTIIPSGTPEYSEKLGGITFDDPVTSLNYLAKWYNKIEPEVKSDPKLWERYLSLAAKPKGVSCEYCCGIGPQGADAQGKSRCGCQHNPALLAITMGLLKHTDYSDAQILREVMKWKALFFPKNMVEVATKVAGADPSSLKELPGMVGGC